MRKNVLSKQTLSCFEFESLCSTQHCSVGKLNLYVFVLLIKKKYTWILHCSYVGDLEKHRLLYLPVLYKVLVLSGYFWANKERMYSSGDFSCLCAVSTAVFFCLLNVKFRCWNVGPTPCTHPSCLHIWSFSHRNNTGWSQLRPYLALCFSKNNHYRLSAGLAVGKTADFVNLLCFRGRIQSQTAASKVNLSFRYIKNWNMSSTVGSSNMKVKYMLYVNMSLWISSVKAGFLTVIWQDSALCWRTKEHSEKDFFIYIEIKLISLISCLLRRQFVKKN